MNHEIEDKKELKEELGKKIKSIREAMGISQRELARRIDLPNSNLKYIEDGINAPSFEIYKKIIIQILKIEREWIIYIQEFEGHRHRIYVKL